MDRFVLYKGKSGRNLDHAAYDSGAICHQCMNKQHFATKDYIFFALWF